MRASDWRGVIPAITTPFDEGLAVDTHALGEHVDWLVGAGCTGIVTLGSLGEAPALTTPERVDIVRTCVRAARGRVPSWRVSRPTRPRTRWHWPVIWPPQERTASWCCHRTSIAATGGRRGRT